MLSDMVHVICHQDIINCIICTNLAALPFRI